MAPGHLHLYCEVVARRWATFGTSSACIRMAAPVGHAATHAGPVFRSLHMSHFTAVFAASADDFFNSRPRKPGRGSTSAIWITPYGQFSSQLAQPMQVSLLMNTSPLGMRAIALGGQSRMQCGCSQWRHDVGRCRLKSDGPALRSSRD